MAENQRRASIGLEAIVSDGWFEQLGQEIPEFDDLCEILGKRFVAFAFIAGVQVGSIAYNQEDPEESLVGFRIGKKPDLQNLSVKQFRKLVAESMLSEGDPPVELPPAPGPEDIRRAIGNRYLLLAPVFGIHLIDLRYGGSDPPTVLMAFAHAKDELTIQTFRDLLREGVRTTLANARSSAAPFSIDFRRIPAAEAANRQGDYSRTIGLLGAWPGPLSLFIRTPQGQGLGTTEKATLARAMGVLGAAYLAKGQREAAEDVLRLGIQWGQETRFTAELFFILGEARLQDNGAGEAIGLLRRALALGASPAAVLPKLASGFAACKRFVAAAACLEDALAAGADPTACEDVRRQVEQALGTALVRLRENLRT